MYNFFVKRRYYRRLGLLANAPRGLSMGYKDDVDVDHPEHERRVVFSVF